MLLMENRYDITKEEIVDFPVVGYDGMIKVVDDYGDFKEALGILSKESVIGFDTETKPAFAKGVKHNVAIIQLATSECVFLLRLKKLGFPQELADILSDGNRIKVGMAIGQDLKGLKKLKKFEPGGFVDLATITAQLGYKCEGVKKLSALILGIQINKRQQVSNWEADKLSDAQILYAATDAWVCREMYFKLNERT